MTTSVMESAVEDSQSLMGDALGTAFRAGMSRAMRVLFFVVGAVVLFMGGFSFALYHVVTAQAQDTIRAAAQAQQITAASGRIGILESAVADINKDRAKQGLAPISTTAVSGTSDAELVSQIVQQVSRSTSHPVSGVSGASVSSVVRTPDCHLVIAVTQPHVGASDSVSTYDLGPICGPSGPAGAVGPAGSPGAPGAPGTAGAPGQPPASYTMPSADGSSTLTCTRSAGSPDSAPSYNCK